jgi:hypothetical protein
MTNNGHQIIKLFTGYVQHQLYSEVCHLRTGMGDMHPVSHDQIGCHIIFPFRSKRLNEYLQDSLWVVVNSL